MESKAADKPEVVVLMSVYSGEKYIDAQMDSLLHQKGVNLKILIRDDGSPDASTYDKLELWRAEYPEIINLYRGVNKGFALSFTELVKVGTEKYPEAGYFAFCDQDDVWLPDKLIRAIGMLSNEPEKEIPLCYASNTLLVNSNLESGRLRWDPDKVKITPYRAVVQNFATGCTVVFNRAAAELYSAVEVKTLRAHDFRMYQLCVFTGKFIWDSESRILYRQHENNLIGKKGLTGRMKNRLKHLRNRGLLESQSKELLINYSDYINSANRKLLERFINYRRSLKDRLWLLTNRAISYDSAESDFFYRLKILMGKL